MDAAPIVHELGYLPLAIDQAGAYIYMKKRSLDEFLKVYRERRQKLLGNPRYKGSVVGNPAIYATFDLTYAALEAEALKETGDAAQTALNILNIICFSRNENVMLDMFPRAAYNRDHVNRGEIFPLSDPDGSHTLEGLFELDEDEEWNLKPFDDGLILLVDYCLVKMDDTHSMCSMHVLVNTWARDRMTQADYDRNALFARSIMFDSLSGRKNDDEVHFRRRMLPHIHHCLEHAKVKHKDDVLESEYAGKFAVAAEEAGNWDDAASALVRAIRLRKWEYGLHGEPTLQARLKLAHLFVKAGRYGEAEMAALEVFERRQELYHDDPSHRLIIKARVGLTEIYLAQMRFDAAMLHTKYVLDALRSHRTQDGTAIRLNHTMQQTFEALRKFARYQDFELNDALSLRDTAVSDLSEKEQKYAASVEKHGRLHPMTIVVQTDLARLLVHAKRYTEAESHFSFLRAQSSVRHGEFHPTTMELLGDMAEVVMMHGRWIEAEAYVRVLWSVRNATLGSRHPHTLMAAADRAHCLYRQARVREALARVREALARMELVTEQLTIVLGGEHLLAAHARGWTAAFRENLARDTPENQRQAREQCERLTMQHYNGNPTADLNLALPRIPEDGSQLDETELAADMAGIDLGTLAVYHLHQGNAARLDFSILLTGGPSSLWRHHDGVLPVLAQSPEFAVTLRNHQK